MAPGGDTDATVADGASNFQLGLDDLKRRGSALLVVGPVPTELYARASTQMLGAPDEPRRRLLVLNESTDVDDRLVPGIRRSSEWTRTIRYASDARSAAAAAPAASRPMPATNERRVDGELGRLGAAIADDVDDFETLARGLAPAELRVAFDCLPVLLAEYGRHEVFRFLHVLTSHVRARDGMVHVWSPGDRSDEINRTLEPLFDAVVELDAGDEGVRQRGTLGEQNVSSGWFPLDS